MDIRTLVVSNFLMSVVLCALMFILARGRGFEVMRNWGYVLLWFTLGLVIHALRGSIPEIAAVVIGNGVLLVGALYVERCARHANGDDLNDPLGWSIAVLAVVGLGVLYSAASDMRWRGMLFSLAAALLLARAAVRFYQAPGGRAARERSFMAIILASWGVMHFLRAIYFAGAPPWEDFFAPGPANAAAFIPGVVFTPAATVCIVWMELASTTAGLAIAGTPSRALRSAASGSAQPPAYATPKATVLLVDDDRDHRESTAELLNSLGYETREAESADAARALLDGNLAQPDAVLLDVVMPGRLSGLGLARELKTHRPELKVILLTGYATELANAHREGLPVIPKPFSIDVLVAALESELAKPVVVPG